MRKTDLKRCRDLLLEKRKAMMEEMGIIDETHGTTIKEATGDLSHYSYHMADQGTDSQEREKAFLFASRESQYFERLELAIKRIEEGTFGICAKCKNPIDKERLEAVPIATMCVECKMGNK